MADNAQLKEIQEYLEYRDSITALEKFIEMFTIPDQDGNLGAPTTTANTRVEYNDGSSARVHTSMDFNKLLGEFIDANIIEISGRIALYAHEKLEKERNEAQAAVGDLDILPVPKPYVFSETVNETAGVHFTYQVKAAHAGLGDTPTVYALANPSASPTGLSIDATTGVITGAPTVPAGTWTVAVSVTNEGGTGTGNITFIVVATA